MDEPEVLPYHTGVEDERVPYRVVTSFEDLLAWQLARELTADIYGITRESAIYRDFGLRDQMRRAGVSIMSNIAEGHERGSSQEYYRFLAIAKGSCAELRSQLFAALDADYISADTFSDVAQKAKRVGQLIGALRSSIRRHLEQTESTLRR